MEACEVTGTVLSLVCVARPERAVLVHAEEGSLWQGFDLQAALCFLCRQDPLGSDSEEEEEAPATPRVHGAGSASSQPSKPLHIFSPHSSHRAAIPFIPTGISCCP